MTGFSVLVIEPSNVGRGMVAADHYIRLIRELTGLKPEGQRNCEAVTMPPALDFPAEYQVISIDFPTTVPGESDVLVISNVGIPGHRLSNADALTGNDPEALKLMSAIGAVSSVIGRNPGELFGIANRTEFFVFYFTGARKSMRDNFARGNRAQLRVV